jgi:hypothetical protein
MVKTECGREYFGVVTAAAIRAGFDVVWYKIFAFGEGAVMANPARLRNGIDKCVIEYTIWEAERTDIMAYTAIDRHIRMTYRWAGCVGAIVAGIAPFTYN